MQLTIAKVNETLFAGDAYQVTLPTAAGELTILGSHMPLVTTLKPGMIHVRATREGVSQDFAVESGVLEVTPSGATVLL